MLEKISVLFIWLMYLALLIPTCN